MTELLVGGIPLIIVIFGLVEFIKSFGLAGKIVTGLSLVLGVLFGVGYKIAESGTPATFAEWFAVAVFGIALGLVASGFYKFAEARFPAVKPTL